ncbi:hypothetical protein [Paenibacillus sp. Marseille-Q7038]
MLNNDPYVTPERDTPPEAPIVSVKSWMLTMFLLAIPIVNIILLFVWAFGRVANPSKANYAKAYLLWIGIVIAIYIVFILIYLFATTTSN